MAFIPIKKNTDRNKKGDIFKAFPNKKKRLRKHFSILKTFFQNMIESKKQLIALENILVKKRAKMF